MGPCPAAQVRLGASLDALSPLRLTPTEARSSWKPAECDRSSEVQGETKSDTAKLYRSEEGYAEGREYKQVHFLPVPLGEWHLPFPCFLTASLHHHFTDKISDVTHSHQLETALVSLSALFLLILPSFLYHLEHIWTAILQERWRHWEDQTLAALWTSAALIFVVKWSLPADHTDMLNLPLYELWPTLCFHPLYHELFY